MRGDAGECGVGGRSGRGGGGREGGLIIIKSCHVCVLFCLPVKATTAAAAAAAVAAPPTETPQQQRGQFTTRGRGLHQIRISHNRATVRAKLELPNI